MAVWDPLLSAFRAESDELLVERWSSAVPAVLCALAIASFIPFLFSPEASLWAWVAVVLAQAGVALTLNAARPRLRRLRATRVAIPAAAAALVALMLGGLYVAACPFDKVVLYSVLAIVAAPVVLPWGTVIQAGFAGAVVATALSVIAAAGGAPGELAMTLALLAVASGVSVLCTHQLELQRFAILSDTLRRESEATFEGRLLAAVEGIDVALDDPSSLDRVAAAARDGLRREWALIFRYDEARQVAQIVGGCGHEDLAIDSLRLWQMPLDEMPLLVEIARRGQLEIGNVAKSEIEIPPLLSRWRCVSLLGVTLRRGNGVAGILLVGAGRRGHRIDPMGRRLFAEIARRATTAIGNICLLEDLRAAGVRKGEFLATLSHELRSPLDVIVGYADMLNDHSCGPLTPAQREILLKLRSYSVNLAEFAAATLETQRLEMDEIQEPLRWIDLQTVIQAMQRDARALPRHRNVDLEWDTTTKPLRLFTDPHKLLVTVKNLVGNALKFTEMGRVVACVHADEARQRLEISVRDTGRGIDEDELPHVFEIFYRGATNADDPIQGGAGLGLYIVKSFVTQLGGTVHTHSEPGRGSIFRVSLPMQADDQSPAARAAAKLVA